MRAGEKVTNQKRVVLVAEMRIRLRNNYEAGFVFYKHRRVPFNFCGSASDATLCVVVVGGW